MDKKNDFKISSLPDTSGPSYAIELEGEVFYTETLRQAFSFLNEKLNSDVSAELLWIAQVDQEGVLYFPNEEVIVDLIPSYENSDYSEGGYDCYGYRLDGGSGDAYVSDIEDIFLDPCSDMLEALRRIDFDPSEAIPVSLYGLDSRGDALHKVAAEVFPLLHREGFERDKSPSVLSDSERLDHIKVAIDNTEELYESVKNMHVVMEAFTAVGGNVGDGFKVPLDHHYIEIIRRRSAAVWPWLHPSHLEADSAMRACLQEMATELPYPRECLSKIGHPSEEVDITKYVASALGGVVEEAYELDSITILVQDDEWHFDEYDSEALSLEGVNTDMLEKEVSSFMSELGFINDLYPVPLDSVLEQSFGLETQRVTHEVSSPEHEGI